MRRAAQRPQAVRRRRSVALVVALATVAVVLGVAQPQAEAQGVLDVSVGTGSCVAAGSTPISASAVSCTVAPGSELLVLFSFVAGGDDRRLCSDPAPAGWTLREVSAGFVTVDGERRHYVIRGYTPDAGTAGTVGVSLKRVFGSASRCSRDSGSTVVVSITSSLALTTTTLAPLTATQVDGWQIWALTDDCAYYVRITPSLVPLAQVGPRGETYGVHFAIISHNVCIDDLEGGLYMSWEIDAGASQEQWVRRGGGLLPALTDCQDTLQATIVARWRFTFRHLDADRAEMASHNGCAHGGGGEFQSLPVQLTATVTAASSLAARVVWDCPGGAGGVEQVVSCSTFDPDGRRIDISTGDLIDIGTIEAPTLDLDRLAECFRRDGTDSGLFGWLQTAADTVVNTLRGVGCVLWELFGFHGDRLGAIMFRQDADCTGSAAHCGQLGVFTWWLVVFSDDPGTHAQGCGGPTIAAHDWLSPAFDRLDESIEGAGLVRTVAEGGDGSDVLPEKQRSMLAVSPLGMCEGDRLAEASDDVRPLLSSIAIVWSALLLLAIAWALPRLLAAHR